MSFFFLFTIYHLIYILPKTLKSSCTNNYDATSFHHVPLLCATTGHLQTLQTTANQPHVTEIRKEGSEYTCGQKGVLCLISGFCRKVAEKCTILGYVTASRVRKIPQLAA